MRRLAVFLIAAAARIPSTGDRLKPEALAHTEIHITDAGWRLLVSHGNGATSIEGPEAIQLLARIIPWIYAGGGSDKDVDAAIALIERAGGPHRFLETRLTPEWLPPGRHKIVSLPPALVHAIEMAANEETEARQVRSGLSLVDLRAADAGETSAIAERLGDP